jgi:acyl-CoA thioesterase-1
MQQAAGTADPKGKPMTTIRQLLLLLVLLAFLCKAASAERPRQELVQVEEDPKLPRVLLIGDSISMGYTLPLRALLKGKANLQHATENCLSSRNIAAKIDQYLGDRSWDVIVFNCGIHDLTYRDAERNFLFPEKGGKIDVPLDQYRENLEKIVTRLEKSEATLIWCTTSPVGEHVGHRLPADVAKYNAAAKTVLETHKIQIADPYRRSTSLDQPELTVDGVHFTRKGYRQIADKLAPVVDAALVARSKAQVHASK